MGNVQDIHMTEHRKPLVMLSTGKATDWQIQKFKEALKQFYKRLPQACPFCGYIGPNPRYHGYDIHVSTENGLERFESEFTWTCPVKILYDSWDALTEGNPYAIIDE